MAVQADGSGSMGGEGQGGRKSVREDERGGECEVEDENEGKVLMPVRADKMGPIVEPQAQSCRTTNSWTGTPTRLPSCLGKGKVVVSERASVCVVMYGCVSMHVCMYVYMCALYVAHFEDARGHAISCVALVAVDLDHHSSCDTPGVRMGITKET